MADVLYMGITTLVRLLTSVVLFIILARVWSVSYFGEFMYWFTVSSVVVILVDFGLSQSLLRDVGRDPDNAGSALRAALEAKVILALFVLFGGVAVCVAFQVNSFGVLLFIALFLTGAVASFAETMNAVYRGLGLFKSETKIVIFSNILYFLTAVLFLYWFKSAIAVALGMLISRLVYFFISTSVFGVAKTINRLPFSVFRAVLYIKRKVSFGLDAFLTNFYSSIDTILVQYYLGSNSVGVYQAGVRLMQGGNMLAQVLSNVYIPKIARVQNNNNDLVQNMRWLLFYMVMAGGVISLVFAYFSRDIVSLLYGERYIELASLLPFFGVVLLVRYIAAAYGVGLAGLGLQSRRVIGIFGSICVLIASCGFLIGDFEMYGILLSLIVSTAFLAIFYFKALGSSGYLITAGWRNVAVIAIFFLLLAMVIRYQLPIELNLIIFWSKDGG